MRITMKGTRMAIVYVGSFVRIAREKIPMKQHPCPCNGKVPETKFCPDCGRKKIVHMDETYTENDVVEIKGDSDTDELFLAILDKSMTVHHDLCTPLFKQITTYNKFMFHNDMPDEVKRLIDLGGEYVHNGLLIVND